MQAQLTQLEADYGIEWQDFRLDELFGKSSRGRRLRSADRIDGLLPFVTAGEANTGISAWIGNDVHIFSKNTVTIDMFGSAKYRGYNYGADDHVAVVHTEKLPSLAVQFLVACIHKSSHAGQFDYSRNFYASDADELNIQLPTIRQNGVAQIAFDFMEAFIATLKAERLATLKAYLTVTGLTDTTLTSAEQTALDSLDAFPWGTFKIEALFDVLTTKKKFNALDVKFGGKHRYIARGERNNGIRGYISEDEIYLNEANTISFGQDTATLFYQNQPYFTGDKIKVFQAKTDVKLNRNTAQIFISSLKKAFLGFSWGSSSYNVDILNTTQIQLPITDEGRPDYDTMSLVVSALQKVVIQGVVSYLDARIETTAELV